MDSGRFLGAYVATALTNGTPAGGEKSNLLFLNPFILTAHGSEVPEQLQGSHISGESFQFTAFPPKLCGVYKKVVSPEDDLGNTKGFSQAATQHHEGQTDVIITCSP